MASISTLGVGSGLQLGDILDSLTAAQKAQLTPISKLPIQQNLVPTAR